MYGDPVTLELPDGTVKQVDNVLISTKTDISYLTALSIYTRFVNQERYAGDTEVLTVSWPKTNADVLKNAKVTIGEDVFNVYANPRKLPPQLTPTKWDRRVTLIRALFLHDAKLLSATSTQDEWGGWTTTYDEKPVKINILRKVDERAYDSKQIGVTNTMMAEIRNEDYDGEQAIIHNGKTYQITGVIYANDTSILTCEGGIIGGHSGGGG